MNEVGFHSEANLIGVSGDWHGNVKWARVALNTFDNSNIKLILQLGDFGISNGESGNKYLETINSILEENKQTLIVTLGNHEDYDELKSFVPHPALTGFVYKSEFPNILIATRGARFNVDCVSFVSLGGANSIDRWGRVEGLSWWSEEQITLTDVYNTVTNGSADVMLTHDCPSGVDLWSEHSPSDMWAPMEVLYSNIGREMLRQAVDGVKPKLLLHGHYHFLNDVTTLLNDGVNDYTMRSVGLDMDGSHNNLGILSMRDLSLRLLPISWDKRNYI